MIKYTDLTIGCYVQVDMSNGKKIGLVESFNTTDITVIIQGSAGRAYYYYIEEDINPVPFHPQYLIINDWKVSDNLYTCPKDPNIKVKDNGNDVFTLYLYDSTIEFKYLHQLDCHCNIYGKPIYLKIGLLQAVFDKLNNISNN